MADRPNRKVKTNFQPCIIVHGGAWAIPDVLIESSVRGVKKAAEIGYESLITVKVLFLPATVVLIFGSVLVLIPVHGN